MEGWKQACQEICAAKGEPPCFKLIENCEPCEDCKVVGVVIDEKDTALRKLFYRHPDQTMLTDEEYDMIRDVVPELSPNRDERPPTPEERDALHEGLRRSVRVVLPDRDGETK